MDFKLKLFFCFCFYISTSEAVVNQQDVVALENTLRKLMSFFPKEWQPTANDAINIFKKILLGMNSPMQTPMQPGMQPQMNYPQQYMQQYQRYGQPPYYGNQMYQQPGMGMGMGMGYPMGFHSADSEEGDAENGEGYVDGTAGVEGEAAGTLTENPDSNIITDPAQDAPVA